MKSEFFKLNLNDIAKGLLIAVLAPLLAALSTAMNVPGFEFSSLDIVSLVKIGGLSGLSYLLKNLLSDHQGKVLGKL